MLIVPVVVEGGDSDGDSGGDSCGDSGSGGFGGDVCVAAEVLVVVVGVY